MTLSQSIICALAYSDVFDYPLTDEEVWLWLPEKESSYNLVTKKLGELVKSKKIGLDKGLYFLKGRGKIVKLRLTRAKESKRKVSKALQAASILKLIPSVIFVGLTGALAVENSDKGDDIDFLVVSYPGTVWLTRLVSTILLGLVGARRGRGSRGNRDKICLNMFVDFDNLNFSPHNIYVAHEILQMKTLWDKGGVEANIFKRNMWVWKIFPNQKELHPILNKSKKLKRLSWLGWLENIAYRFQLLYMRKHITREIIGKNFLAFHPRDTEGWVMGEYQKRLECFL